MGKMYTLDNKLLTETPEIRIGDKVYSVDDRVNTVKKIQEISKNISDDLYGSISEVLTLALGPKAAKEIENMNMPYAAYQKMFELVMAAITGEDADVIADRFQDKEK